MSASMDEEDKRELSKEDTYEDLVKLVCPIAQPLANETLTLKLLKLVRKCSKEKKIRRGVREVVKSLRKDFKGLVVFAGDVSPIDVISHIPVFCEEKEIPYCYIPTRRQLGMASGTKRPTCVVLIQNHSKYEKLYEKCSKKVKDLPLPL